MHFSKDGFDIYSIFFVPRSINGNDPFNLNNCILIIIFINYDFRISIPASKRFAIDSLSPDIIWSLAPIRVKITSAGDRAHDSQGT